MKNLFYDEGLGFHDETHIYHVEPFFDKYASHCIMQINEEELRNDFNMIFFDDLDNWDSEADPHCDKDIETQRKKIKEDFKEVVDEAVELAMSISGLEVVTEESKRAMSKILDLIPMCYPEHMDDGFSNLERFVEYPVGSMLFHQDYHSSELVEGLSPYFGHCAATLVAYVTDAELFGE